MAGGARDERLHPRQTSIVPDSAEPPDRPVPPASREAVQRWRLTVARDALGAEAGQREQLAAWELALARSGLPVAGLDIEPPRPRVVMAAPLGASMRGEAELFDTWLTERLPAWRVREALAGSMAPGYRLIDIHDAWLGEPALPGRVAASVYRAELVAGAAAPDALRRACAALLAAPTLPRARAKGDGTVRYDLRPFIEALDVTADGTALRMTLRHDPERGVGRPDEVLAALSEAVGADVAAARLVRECLVLNPLASATATRAGPRGRPRREGGRPPAAR